MVVLNLAMKSELVKILEIPHYQQHENVVLSGGLHKIHFSEIEGLPANLQEVTVTQEKPVTEYQTLTRMYQDELALHVSGLTLDDFPLQQLGKNKLLLTFSDQEFGFGGAINPLEYEILVQPKIPNDNVIFFDSSGRYHVLLVQKSEFTHDLRGVKPATVLSVGQEKALLEHHFEKKHLQNATYESFIRTPYDGLEIRDF